MIATDRPGLENVLTTDGKARWHALQAAVGRVGPEPKLAHDFWTLTDRLGHEPYASAIARFIRHRDTRSPLTIGIAAPWGVGKTSLMRMVQEDLDPRDASGKRQNPAHKGRQKRDSPRMAVGPQRSPTRSLEDSDVRFDLCIQQFVDDRTTPIEDTAVEWTKRASTPVPVAVLTIRKPCGSTAETIVDARSIDELSAYLELVHVRG